MDKLRLNIDGRELEGYKGQTILEVATDNGIDIPTFCHDKRMDIYGSCGICVVEAEGMPKLLRACATEISDGMVIRTDTPRIRESRKVNLELLMSQHTGDCRAPCSKACPAQTDCQGYVGLIANGEMEEALKLIKAKIPLAASLGRVCPHPCEDECRRRLVEEPVSIQNLKRFAADIDLSNPEPYLPDIAPATGKSIGVTGGGPGGLSSAYFLAAMGHSVTVYDAMPK
ncbi:MAG: (2Fe-2S)-binding protein, partial [Oscillospiraceae bacterium]|nr:(2Fe-2S)-binding protein [Oscillospiraceae bacterium]